MGDEAGTFQSPTSWKEIIGSSDRIEAVETWEMECFDVAWNEWFATENEYAAGDKQYFDTHSYRKVCPTNLEFVEVKNVIYRIFQMKYCKEGQGLAFRERI